MSKKGLFRLFGSTLFFGVAGAFPFAYVFAGIDTITKSAWHLVFENNYIFASLCVIIGIFSNMVLNLAKECCQKHFRKWLLFFIGWSGGLTIFTTLISLSV